jgi:hypothetical protein
LKTALKLIPFIIGFAIMQGIMGASAQCNYIGVAVNDSYDFTLSGSVMLGGIQETISGNIHVHVYNVTFGNPCTVGVTVTPPGAEMIGFSPIYFHNGTYKVIDSLTVDYANANLIISKNVVNKTYDEKIKNYYETGEMLVTWDLNGMLNSITMTFNATLGGMQYTSHELVQRVGGVTLGPDPIVFAGFFIFGIAIIILKKRGMHRVSNTTT